MFIRHVFATHALEPQAHPRVKPKGMLFRPLL
jgi:hypothetical protein